MACVDIRLELPDELGERFRHALLRLAEAHCQDMRDMRELRAATPPTKQPQQGSIAKRVGSFDTLGQLSEGQIEQAGWLSQSIDRPPNLLEVPQTGEAACRPCPTLRRATAGKSTAAEKLRARMEAVHAVRLRASTGELPVHSKKTTLTSAVSADRLNDLIPGLKNMLGTNFLERMVTSVAFEMFSACVVLVFCAISALQLQREGLTLGYELRYPRYGDPTTLTGWDVLDDVLRVLNFVCGILFVIEYVLRFSAAGRRFFSDVWCYFDLIMILGWAVELISDALDSSVYEALRPVRLARLLRFVRMIHVIKHFQHLYLMVKALTGSLKILGWACLLLLGFQTLTAFVITELLNTFYFPNAEMGPESAEVFEYFGSFARSLLTTFEMAMGNWPIPARVLFEHVSEWFILIFLAHKLSVGFAFLGVINAVFIQETFHIAATDDLTMLIKKQKNVDTQRRKLERLFRSADTGENGRISREGFKRLLKHKDVQMWLASMDYQVQDPEDLFDALDYNCSGDLSASEFFTGMVALRGTARAMDLVGLMQMQLEHDQMLKQICRTLAPDVDAFAPDVDACAPSAPAPTSAPTPATRTRTGSSRKSKVSLEDLLDTV